MRGYMDQVGAVVVGHDAHALGEDALVELLDLLAYARQRRQGLLTAPHQDDPLDNVPLVILAHPPGGYLSADTYRAEVFDIDGSAVRGKHGHMGDIVRVFEQANTADVVALPPEFEVIRSDIDVTIGNRCQDLRNRDIVGGELGRIQVDVELFG